MCIKKSVKIFKGKVQGQNKFTQITHMDESCSVRNCLGK